MTDRCRHQKRAPLTGPDCRGDAEVYGLAAGTTLPAVCWCRYCGAIGVRTGHTMRLRWIPPERKATP